MDGREPPGTGLGEGSKESQGGFGGPGRFPRSFGEGRILGLPWRLSGGILGLSERFWRFCGFLGNSGGCQEI